MNKTNFYDNWLLQYVELKRQQEMDPITSLFSSVMEKASEVAEVVGDKFMKDVCPDFLKTSTTEVPSYQIEAAAHSACNFFGSMLGTSIV